MNNATIENLIIDLENTLTTLESGSTLKHCKIKLELTINSYGLENFSTAQKQGIHSALNCGRKVAFTCFIECMVANLRIALEKEMIKEVGQTFEIDGQTYEVKNGGYPNTNYCCDHCHLSLAENPHKDDCTQLRKEGKRPVCTNNQNHFVRVEKHNEVIDVLKDRLSDMIQAQKMPHTYWVIEIEGVFIQLNRDRVSPENATRFSTEKACNEIARTMVNGNNVRGKAVWLPEALQVRIKKVKEFIVMLDRGTINI
ncbi:MAG: hypothetical protein GY799_21085 [Desulfobulbaceae bacterium]|nr:hypothetical protein [Desulfobulbaceae bacterium]